MSLWKNTDKRALYIGAVIGKLRMEGKTHLALEQVEQLLRDAFQVEAADDFAAEYYVKTINETEGPLPFADACKRASKLADKRQSDVQILQAFDTFYYIDY